MPDADSASADPAPPPTGRRLHPASPFLRLVAFNPRSTVPFVALLVTSRREWLFGLALLGVLAWLAIGWWRTTYELDERRLVVSSGVLNRTIRIVAPDRVQQVEVVRRVRHRLLGLTSVRIELAEAGSSTDRAIVLDAMSMVEGARVQSVLDRARHCPESVEPGSDLAPPRPVPEVLFRAPLGMLAVGGLIGAPVFLVPLAVLTLLDEFRDLGGDLLDPGPLRGAALTAAGLLGLVLWAVVAAGQMVVRHAGLVVTRRAGEIQIARGLFERRTSVIPLRRVQLVEVSATFVRRAGRLATIDIRTAGQLDLEGTGSLDNAVPIIASDAVEPLVAVLLDRPTGRLPVPDRRHPVGALRRSLIFRLPLVAAPAVVVALVARPAAGAVVGGIGLLLASVGAGWWYRTLAHGVDDGVLVVRSGVANRSSRYGRLGRAQSLTMAQGPLQRVLGVVTVRAQLAGGSQLVVRDVTPVQAAQLYSETFGRPQPSWSLAPAAAG